jgi:hypothetical protein
MQIDLKPCPSCLSKEVRMANLLEHAFTDHLSDDDVMRLESSFMVVCMNTNCGVMSWHYNSREEAAENWNKRADTKAEITIGDFKNGSI